MAGMRFALVGILAAVLLGGCGGSELRDHGTATTGAKLEVRAETYELGGSGKLTLSQSAQADGTQLIEVRAAEAAALKSAYFAVRFDPQRWQLAHVEQTAALAGGSALELLSLSRLAAPGELHCGQCLVHPTSHAGFSGSGVLARVTLAPGRAAAGRTASAPPLSPQARFPVQGVHLDGGIVLSWPYHSPGDYDQNSEVNIADLTPVAVHFGKTGGPFDFVSIESVVDGDGNGVISIADLTPIGANYGARVSAFNVYGSAQQTDYDPAPQSLSALEPFATIEFAAALGSPAAERLRFAPGQLLGLHDEFVWVRPTDGAAEGTPSELAEITIPQITPPEPALTASPLSGEAPLLVAFDASASVAVEGELASCRWDFDGDGTIDADTFPELTAQHTYAAPGDYEARVILTADNGIAASPEAMASIAISVAAPPPNEPPLADFTGAPLSGTAPLAVDFDAAASTDGDGSIVLYEWDWNNDGTYDDSASIPQMGHTFTAAGSPIVKLRVTDDVGATDTDTLVVTVLPANAPPVADLFAAPPSGRAPLTVGFDGLGSTNDDGALTYEWDFDGDGVYDEATGTTAFTQHLYLLAGVYDAVLRVTDGASQSGTDTFRITVTGGGGTDPPDARLSADPTDGPAPLRVSFDGSASSDDTGIVLVEWDFDGDGVFEAETGTDLTAAHNYAAAGSFLAGLRLTDADGMQATATARIEVGR